MGDFSFTNHSVDVVGHLSRSLALAEPGNVQIGLSPCLVVNSSLDDRKARWIMDQAFEPFRLALGQQPTRLLRHGCWQWCRGSVGTLTLPSVLAPIPSHLFFRLQKYFHGGLHPNW